MISEKYINFLKTAIQKIDLKSKNRYFIFGSSLRKENFGDVDLGVIGSKKKNLSKLRDFLEDSIFPYFVDVVDFDSADKKFIDYVNKNEKKLWLN